MQPSTIDVTLDIPITRELPVQVDWSGRLPENLNVTRVTVYPEAVKVVGGSKILEKVSTIYTAPVRLDNLTKSGTVVSSLVLTPPSLKLPTGVADRVTVHFVVEEKRTGERR